MEKVIALPLVAMREDGDPVPEPSHCERLEARSPSPACLHRVAGWLSSQAQWGQTQWPASSKPRQPLARAHATNPSASRQTALDAPCPARRQSPSTARSARSSPFPRQVRSQRSRSPQQAQLIGAALSAPRTAAYEAAIVAEAGHRLSTALALYPWNARPSGAFLAPLPSGEVAVGAGVRTRPARFPKGLQTLLERWAL